MAEKVKENRWRLILTVVTIVALIITIIALRSEILTTIKNIKNVNIFALSLLIPLEIINYYAQAYVYQESLSQLGHKLSLNFLARFSLELNFVQTIFPSGGISGFSYSNVRLKQKGVSAGQASLIQIVKLVVIFFSFLILLAIGLLFLASAGRASDVMILISTALVVGLFTFSFIAFYIIGSRARINSFFTFITRILNKIVRIFRPKKTEAINIENAKGVFNELHESYLQFRHDPKVLIKPLIWGTIANLSEVACVYVVYVAFGHWENPGAIIIAYAVANFAGFLSVLPGGIGVYETLMTLVLAAAGIPASLSIPVTIMYRVVNTLIQIVPGYFFYQKALVPAHQNTSTSDG